MQQLFAKDEWLKWWLPSLAAFIFFITGIAMNNLLLMAVPFAALVFLLFAKDARHLFFALLFSVPLSTEFAVTSALSTDLPDEPLMLFLSAALLVAILFKPALFPSQIKKSSLFLLLILQLIWIFIATLYSQELWLSVKYLLAKLWYMMAFVVGSLVFLKEKKDFVLASKMLIFSMMIAVVISLVRQAGYGFTFETVNETVSPFFRNHVNYAALLVCLFPVLIMWQIFAIKNQKVWIRLLLAIFFIALFFSYSRGAWLCLLTGGFTWFAIKKNFLFPAFTVIILLIAASFFWLKKEDRYMQFAPDYNTTIFHPNFAQHVQSTYKMKDISTMERFYRWLAGLKMIEEKKWTGFGPNTFNRYYKSYTNSSFKTWVSNNKEQSTVHNYFLLITIEQGIPGLVVFCLVLFSMFRISIKAYHYFDDPFYQSLSVLCGVVLSMIITLNMLSDLIETDKIGSLFFLLMGIFIFLQVKMKQEKTVKK